MKNLSLKSILVSIVAVLCVTALSVGLSAF